MLEETKSLSVVFESIKPADTSTFVVTNLACTYHPERDTLLPADSNKVLSCIWILTNFPYGKATSLGNYQDPKLTIVSLHSLVQVCVELGHTQLWEIQM